jgi:hypothetical protein
VVIKEHVIPVVYLQMKGERGSLGLDNYSKERFYAGTRTTALVQLDIKYCARGKAHDKLPPPVVGMKSAAKFLQVEKTIIRRIGQVCAIDLMRHIDYGLRHLLKSWPRFYICGCIIIWGQHAPACI